MDAAGIPKEWRANLVRLKKRHEANAPVPKMRKKEAISLRVDRDVLVWFRQQGPRYQTRMNAVLRAYMRRVTSPSTPG